MNSTTWSDALAGMPAVGPDVRLRAPEAAPARFSGTGLPFGGRVVETGAPTVVPAALQRTAHIVHIDATPSTTLGLLSSRRPPG